MKPLALDYIDECHRKREMEEEKQEEIVKVTEG